MTSMTSSVKQTDLDFKTSVALICPLNFFEDGSIIINCCEIALGKSLSQSFSDQVPCITFQLVRYN